LYLSFSIALLLPCFHNLFSSCSDDEEPPTCATTVPPISPLAADEPAEQNVAPGATRAAVKKVLQARNPKRSKKAKETDVPLEAHASTVSPDDVGNSLLLAFLTYAPALTHFFSQALLNRFVTLGTECAGYLKVAKASEGTILTSSHYFFFFALSFAIYLTPFRLLL
jgi:hypothetical protein